MQLVKIFNMARIKTVTWHLPWEAFVSEIFFSIFRSYSCYNNGYTQWDVCNIALVHNYSAVSQMYTRTSCIVQRFMKILISIPGSNISFLTLFLLLATLSTADNFANSLGPDQARQNVGPDLDPNCLTLWWYS